MSATHEIPSTEPPSQLRSDLPPVNVQYIALPNPLQAPTSIPVTMTADDVFKPPCRRCLRDAEPGEVLTLIDYDPFPTTCSTPYRGSTPIFVHTGQTSCEHFHGYRIPITQLGRLMSLRVYDERDMLIAAEVVNGHAFEGVVCGMLADEKAKYVHVHNAKPGCFAFSAVRA